MNWHEGNVQFGYLHTSTHDVPKHDSFERVCVILCKSQNLPHLLSHASDYLIVSA